MAETFKYTREWTDEKAFPLLGFSRDWNNPEDYPTVETDERKVREDMQSLHDEVKNYLNETLIPTVIAEEATVEDWEHAESLRAEAEKARVAAEEARVAAEEERVNDTNGSVSLSKLWADNSKVWAEGGVPTVVLDNGMVSIDEANRVLGSEGHAKQAEVYARGGVLYGLHGFRAAETGAINYADKAAAYAEGGSYKEYASGATADDPMTTITVDKGAKQYAEEARTAATESYDNRVATNTYKEQARSASQSASTSASNASKAETSARSYANAAQSSMQKIEISLAEAQREANKAMGARDEAEAAQVAAEKARDEAQAAVGGDFVTHPELEEALENAGGGVFTAWYGDDTYADVKAAYDEGRALFVWADSSSGLGADISDIQLPLGRTINAGFEFVGHDALNRLVRITCHRTKGWSCTIENAGGVPTPATGDNGKFLRIVNGAPAWATVQNAEEVSF